MSLMRRMVLLLVVWPLGWPDASQAQQSAPLPPLPGPIAQIGVVNRDQAGASVVRPGAASAAPAGGASVSAEVIGPATVAPGQRLPFELIVRNGWVLAASQVRVELPLPPGARLLAG